MAGKAINQSVAIQPVTTLEAEAVKALAAGEANAGQQRAALSVIVKKLSRAFDLTYIPGDTHGSAFLSGRSFVGMNITRLINQPLPPKE